jgi:hypothetical protein
VYNYVKGLEYSRPLTTELTMSKSIFTAIACFSTVMLCGTTHGSEPDVKMKPVALKTLPSPREGQASLVFSEKNLSEFISNTKAPRLTVSLDVTSDDADKPMLRVYLNRLDIKATADDDDGYVETISFYPATQKTMSVSISLDTALAKASKSGMLRLDRPLVLTVIPAPVKVGKEVLQYKGGWSVKSASIQ